MATEIYGFSAAKTPPQHPGTYLVYDYGTPYPDWMLADYNPGSINPDVTPDLSDWATHADCIPYTKFELEHLLWMPLPGQRYAKDSDNSDMLTIEQLRTLLVALKPLHVDVDEVCRKMSCKRCPFQNDPRRYDGCWLNWIGLAQGITKAEEVKSNG